MIQKHTNASNAHEHKHRMMCRCCLLLMWSLWMRGQGRRSLFCLNIFVQTIAHLFIDAFVVRRGYDLCLLYCQIVYTKRERTGR